MKILIKKARIVAPGQKLNGQVKDLLIEDGRIARISEHIDNESDRTVSINNLHLSPGWMDCFAHFCDPGFEYRETLESGASAAAAGGYTTVMVIPNTRPQLDNRAQIEYIKTQAKRLAVNILPIGAVSSALEGKSLAEMIDMHYAGAGAFSDGLHPVQTPGLLLKALQYVKAFDGIIIQLPVDESISKHGLVHEGIWSTKLGISGIPDIAEVTIIKRDLDLLKYTESKLHITGISLKDSVKLIRSAKEEGLPITCSVTPYHLLLTDASLQEFDSNYKVSPPLREQSDVDYLRQALKEGIIDCLASHHLPQDLDSKNKEFEYASKGMIGLETAFGVLGSAIPDWDLEEKIRALVVRSRKPFGLSVPQVEEGSDAELTLFDPDMEWTFDKKTTRSKSQNTPLSQITLKGKPLGIVNKDSFILNKTNPQN